MVSHALGIILLLIIVAALIAVVLIAEQTTLAKDTHTQSTNSDAAPNKGDGTDLAIMASVAAHALHDDHSDD